MADPDTTVSMPPTEQERLQAQLLTALTAQVATYTDLQLTEKKARAIARKRKALQKSSKAARTGIAKALEDLAKEQCLALCEEVHARFPREVRDMIYDCMQSADGTQTVITGTYFDVDRDFLTKPPHWRYAAYVGQKMHQELGEHFFRCNTFTFADGIKGFQRLPSFRTMDESRLGYAPADFACNIDLAVDCSSYATDEFPYWIQKTQGHNYGWVDNVWGSPDTRWKQRHDTKAAFLSTLELMFGFQSGTKIALHLKQRGSSAQGYINVQEWLSENLDSLISPTIQRCKAAGYHMSVSLAVQEGVWDDCPREHVYSSGSFPSSFAIWQDEFRQYKLREMQKLEDAKNGESNQAKSDVDSDPESLLGWDDGDSEEGSEEDSEGQE